MLSILLTIASLLAPSPQPADGTTPRDSVDVLLLSIPSTDTLDIVGATSAMLDGVPVGRSRFGVGKIKGKQRIVAGTRHGASLTVSSARGHPCGIRAGRRDRTVQGHVRVSASADGLVVVARVSLADYLAGTLAEESAARDPIAYRAALAFLQRNYVMANRGRHKPLADLCDNTHCQLFRSTRQPASTREAVRRGAAVRWSDSARPSYYSSCCGGSTLTPGDVWGSSEPGYARVSCRHCTASRWYRWRSSVATGPGADALLSRLPSAPFVSESLKIELGRALGWRLVPSNSIDRVERRAGSWHLAGRGFGHRVGLCQAGARSLAMQGRGVEEILRFYFPAGPP